MCKEDPLTLATRLVNTERQNDYGHPADDFGRTSAMLTGIGFRFIDPATGLLRGLEAKDVPIIQILVKLSREVHKHKDDNLTDCCGYVKTLDLVYARQADKERETGGAELVKQPSIPREELLHLHGTHTD